MFSIKLLQRSQIDDTFWDNFIDNSPHQIIYAYSWYLDIVSPRWTALVAIDGHGYWLAVLPVPLRRKFGFWVVQQPLFCQILGVFFRDNEFNQDIAESLVANLLTEYRYVSTYFGRFLGVKTKNFTQVLYLNQNYETLKNNYSTDRKENLKKAQKYNYQILESTDIEPLIAIFKQNHAHNISGGVSESAYDLLRKLFEKLSEKKIVNLKYAFINKQIEAGCLFVMDKRRIIYIFNAATQIGRQLNTRTLLIDNVLQQYAASGMVFDFESPMIDSISRFYDSFGSQKEYFEELKQNNLPFPFKQIQRWRLEK
jgi:Acetyltransferase (GNAT) domain